MYEDCGEEKNIWGLGLVEEHLPSMHEALGLSLSTEKQQQQQQIYRRM